MTGPARIDPDVGRFVDNSPGDEIPRVAPTLEIGRTGLKRFSGYVEEEFLPQLRGRKAVQVYREMADNCAPIGGFLWAIERLIRGLEWRVEPASSSPADRANAEFVEQCMHDMEMPWGDVIGEVMSMSTYGWNLSEVIYKRRGGPWERDPRRRSDFTDGRMGWRKISTRAQETMLRWVFSEEGDILGMVQMPPPRYQKIVIPIKKSLLFRTTTARNNPEGRSLLRSAYQSWFYYKRIQEIEAVGVERDLTGLPVAFVPPELINAPANSNEAKLYAAYKQMVTAVRRNEQEGLVLPWEIDPETKQPRYDFKLLTSGGTRQFNIEEIIERLKTEMLMCVIADFMMVGHEDNGGSYALHLDKTGLFRAALDSLAKGIADVFNRQAIPRLFALNAIKPPKLPKLVPDDVDAPNLIELSQFLTATAGVGMQWFPDPEMEKFLRTAARLPELSPDVEEIHAVEQRQEAIMGLARQRMEALTMEQQVEQGAVAGQTQQLSNAQTAMGMHAQAQEMQAAQQAGPDGTQGTLNQQQVAGGQMDLDHKQASNKLDLQSRQVKVAQERQKLTNLKRPPAKAPAKKLAVKKAPAKKAGAK